MLMYGVFFDWLLCRTENRPRLASSEYMRVAHTHTHSVVISVLADLLMLTCSACLLGSWCCILSLSLSFSLSLIHSFLSCFFLMFFFSYVSVIYWVMLEMWRYVFTLTILYEPQEPECPWLSQMHECTSMCVHVCVCVIVCTLACAHSSRLSICSLPNIEELI